MDDTRSFSEIDNESGRFPLTTLLLRFASQKIRVLPTRCIHQNKLAKKTIVQKADSVVPVLEPLTAEAAIKIIDPNGAAGTVNVRVHEHNLDAVYQALRYVKKTDVIAESDKSAWAMAVLQLTGMDSIAGLENNRESLRKAAELNCKKHENDEWCLRANELSHQYEMTQKKKFFQKAISNGLTLDP